MNILLVEDEVRIADTLKFGLAEFGFEVSIAQNGNEGWDLFSDGGFDLVILDINLPGMNGHALCKMIRKISPHIPVIMLTALNAIEDKVEGYDAGADDYLVKPFKFNELLARIRALIRRKTGVQQAQQNREESKYSIDDLELDDYTKTVKRGTSNISLTTTEYKLLLLFLKNPRRVLSRTEILESVWDLNFNIGTNVVDVYVNYLRKKIDREKANKLIHTVVGMGYVLKEGNENAN